MKVSPIKVSTTLNRRLRSRWTSLSIAIVVASLIAVTLSATGVSAHPLGNFTVNRYAQIEVGASAVGVTYVVDMAEIPTYQEMSNIDRDHNGTVSDDERTAYLAKKLPELARNLKISVNDHRLGLKVDSGTLSFGEGQGGLKILRIDAVFSAALPSDLGKGAVSAQVRDTNYDDRLGWKEIVVRGSDGAALSQSSVPAQGISDGLRSYPQDSLSSPLNVKEARFQFEPGVPSAPLAENTAAQVARRTSRAVSAGALGRFADSVATKNLTPPLVLFLLLAAVFWGAVHAVGPGHGKTVVAAYLVGSKGTARHAVMLGTTVTATHTASTYLLGFITLFASHFIVPEKLYPALTLTSGILVFGMGLVLLSGRLRAMGAWSFWLRLPLPHWRPALATAGAPAIQQTRSAQLHLHGGSGHTHGHTDSAGHDQSVQHGHFHDHSSASGDDHGHDHAVPGFDGKPVTWRSLLSLGIYGGLIPCPTAIVVLLTSISLNRVGFGLVLVVAFSFGLAAVLTGIGLLLVRAGRMLARFSEGSVTGRIATYLPLASAGAVIIAGLLITLRAAGQGNIPLV